MFAIVNHLHLSRPVDEFQSAVEQEGLPLLAGLPGFRDFLFIKAAADHAIVVLVWQDAASAEAGARAFGPAWFAHNLAPFLTREQERSAGPVLVSPPR